MPIVGDDPIPILLTGGDAHERGRQHGELAQDRVGLSVERYMERFQHFAGLSPSAVRAKAAEFAPIIKAYDPELLEEIGGVADGAGFTLEELLAVNCRSEIMFGTPLPECTSFGLQPEATANGHVYVGQNWDWAPDIKQTLILLIIEQAPKPTVVLLDEAGMIGRMGFNSAGIGLVTNTLISEQWQFGVPYNVLLRGILNQMQLSDAIAAVVRPTRALSANYLIGDARGQTIDIEVSPIHIDHLAPQTGIITHGNHFDGARLSGRDLSLERFPDSLYRSCRLRDQLSLGSGDLTEQDMQDALRDGFGKPHAIAREVDPSQGRFEQLETVASIIIDLTARRFLLAGGAPDRYPYFEFELDKLISGEHSLTA
jgi:isopenicillin-N N-acyltransferase-like protein